MSVLSIEACWPWCVLSFFSPFIFSFLCYSLYNLWTPYISFFSFFLTTLNQAFPLSYQNPKSTTTSHRQIPQFILRHQICNLFKQLVTVQCSLFPTSHPFYASSLNFFTNWATELIFTVPLRFITKITKAQSLHWFPMQ